jgi:hypothetical protein
MVERDCNIFGIAYDMNAFTLLCQHCLGVQSVREVRGNDARGWEGLPSVEALRHGGRTSDLDGEELQDLALMLGELQRGNVALVKDGIEHLIGLRGPRSGI